MKSKLACGWFFMVIGQNIPLAACVSALYRDAEFGFAAYKLPQDVFWQVPAQIIPCGISRRGKGRRPGPRHSGTQDARSGQGPCGHCQADNALFTFSKWSEGP